MPCTKECEIEFLEQEKLDIEARKELLEDYERSLEELKFDKAETDRVTRKLDRLLTHCFIAIWVTVGVLVIALIPIKIVF